MAKMRGKEFWFRLFTDKKGRIRAEQDDINGNWKVHMPPENERPKYEWQSTTPENDNYNPEDFFKQNFWTEKSNLPSLSFDHLKWKDQYNFLDVDFYDMRKGAEDRIGMRIMNEMYYFDLYWLVTTIPAFKGKATINFDSGQAHLLLEIIFNWLADNAYIPYPVEMAEFGL